VDPIETLIPLVQAAVAAAFGDEHRGIDPQVRRSDRADAQIDVAMRLARVVKQPPPAVAAKIVAAIPPNEVIEKLEVAGPGFLNVTLRADWLAAAATTAAADPRLGVPTAATPDRVVIDYSAPNVAKEMHVGHLRSTVIGDALARLLGWRGHTVIAQNHLGDWGTPFGMLIEHLVDLHSAPSFDGAARSGEAGPIELGAVRATDDLAIRDLAAFYKAARGKFDSDEAFKERSRLRVVALQGGDPETLAKWRVLVEVSQRYFEAVYAKLGVLLTSADICAESFYNDRLPPLAAELEASGKATISDGALCLFPAGFVNREKQPLPLIVRKADGGYGYATTDLAAIRYRHDELRASRLLYVVGAPQAGHLAMVFQAARELGWLTPSDRVEHVAFGSVLGTDGKMFQSRAGETVRLVGLIDEAIARADAKVQEKSPELEPAVRAEVARMVGVGSIKYADLSSDRIKNYTFDLDRMVSFDGDTAGYLQYAHARIRSIFRKAGANATPGPIRVEAPNERALVLTLLGLGPAVKSVETSLEPHRLAGYLHDLGMAFTAFYESCPILRTDIAPDVRASRLALADLTAKTLAQGLALLGIDVPDRM
jgi:arginyl-tRNA synthetase